MIWGKEKVRIWLGERVEVLGNEQGHRGRDGMGVEHRRRREEYFICASSQEMPSSGSVSPPGRSRGGVLVPLLPGTLCENVGVGVRV